MYYHRNGNDSLVVEFNTNMQVEVIEFDRNDYEWVTHPIDFLWELIPGERPVLTLSINGDKNYGLPYTWVGPGNARIVTQERSIMGMNIEGHKLQIYVEELETKEE